MANSGTKDSNQSQFFMTLNECPWLDLQHTIFGRIEGPTIYNLLKIGDVDTDKSQKPISSILPKINSVQVILNPFEDIEVRNISRGVVQRGGEKSNEKGAPVKIKKIVVKSKQMLSFDDE